MCVIYVIFTKLLCTKCRRNSATCLCSVPQLCPTLCDPHTIACQAPLSMKFSRQEYWSGLSLPIPGYLLNPGIKPAFLSSPALTGGFFITSATSTEIPPHKQIIPLRRAKKKKCFTRQSSHFRRMKMKQWNSERLWLAHSGKVTKLKQNQMLKQCFSYK